MSPLRSSVALTGTLVPPLPLANATADVPVMVTFVPFALELVLGPALRPTPGPPFVPAVLPPLVHLSLPQIGYPSIKHRAGLALLRGRGAELPLLLLILSRGCPLSRRCRSGTLPERVP